MKKTVVTRKNAITTGDGIFKGWGTSLCWWANRVGGSRTLTKKAGELFFSPEKGLGLNIMRHNIGGGDDPDHNHIVRTDSMMPGYMKKDKITGEISWCCQEDERQLNILSECFKSAGEDAFVEVFSNSPPWFMTVSSCSSGHSNPRCNNLRQDCVGDFARYLVGATEYIEKNSGIKVGSLAPMNEPYTDYWYKNSPKQEGCHISPGKRQSELLIEVGQELEKRGLSHIHLTASDETSSKKALKSFRRLSCQALSRVDRISTHTYDKATRGILRACREKGLELWMTETDWSGVSGENAGEMGPALWLGEKIIEDINTIEPCAWVIWQVVAAYISREGFMGRQDMKAVPDLSQGYWGCAVAEIDREEYILTQKYYAFGQFSRYIRPGMRIILTDKSSLCAYDEEKEKLVIVAVNPKKDDMETKFMFDGTGAFSSVEAVRTSGDIKTGEHWAEVSCGKLGEGSLTVSLRGNSITTFILTK